MNKKNKNSNLPLGDLIKLGSKSKSTSNKQNVQIPPKKVTPVSHSSKNSETQSKTKKDPLNNPLASNQSIIKKQINDTISQILLKCSSNIKDAKAHIDDKNSFNLTDLVLDLLQYISDDILNYSNIITIALTAVLKLDAGVFNNKEIVALCAIILKNFSNLIPKSNCELVYEQSFISIVLISFQDYDEWPIEFFESYLYDALNYKQDLKWSTDPVNHTFVENIKTAFISHIDDKVRNYKHNAAIACNELLNEKIEANIFPRYVSRVDSVSSAFRKIISMDQISQVTENSSNILNICLKTENLAPCKIICINVFETLIQHPKHLKEAQELMAFILKSNHSQGYGSNFKLSEFYEQLAEKLLNLKFKNRSAFPFISQAIVAQISDDSPLLLQAIVKIILENDILMSPLPMTLIQEFAKKYNNSLLISIRKFFASSIPSMISNEDVFTKKVAMLRDINKICRADISLEYLYKHILENCSDLDIQACETLAYVNNNVILLHINSMIKDEINAIDHDNRIIRQASNLFKFFQTADEVFISTLDLFISLLSCKPVQDRSQNDQQCLTAALSSLLQFKIINTEYWKPDHEINILKQLFTEKKIFSSQIINLIGLLISKFDSLYRLASLDLLSKHLLSIASSNDCYILEQLGPPKITCHDFIESFFKLVSQKKIDTNSPESYNLLYQTFWKVTEILLIIGIKKESITNNDYVLQFRQDMINDMPHTTIILQCLIYKMPNRLKSLIDSKQTFLFPSVQGFLYKYSSVEIPLQSADPEDLMTISNLMMPPEQFIDTLKYLENNTDLSMCYLSGASTGILDSTLAEISFNFIESNILKFEWLLKIIESKLNNLFVLKVESLFKIFSFLSFSLKCKIALSPNIKEFFYSLKLHLIDELKTSSTNSFGIFDYLTLPEAYANEMLKNSIADLFDESSDNRAKIYEKIFKFFTENKICVPDTYLKNFILFESDVQSLTAIVTYIFNSRKEVTNENKQIKKEILEVLIEDYLKICLLLTNCKKLDIHRQFINILSQFDDHHYNRKKLDALLVICFACIEEYMFLSNILKNHQISLSLFAIKSLLNFPFKNKKIFITLFGYFESLLRMDLSGFIENDIHRNTLKTSICGADEDQNDNKISIKNSKALDIDKYLIPKNINCQTDTNKSTFLLNLKKYQKLIDSTGGFQENKTLTDKSGIFALYSESSGQLDDSDDSMGENSNVYHSQIFGGEANMKEEKSGLYSQKDGGASNYNEIKEIIASIYYDKKMNSKLYIVAKMLFAQETSKHLSPTMLNELFMLIIKTYGVHSIVNLCHHGLQLSQSELFENSLFIHFLVAVKKHRNLTLDSIVTILDNLCQDASTLLDILTKSINALLLNKIRDENNLLLEQFYTFTDCIMPLSHGSKLTDEICTTVSNNVISGIIDKAQALIYLHLYCHSPFEYKSSSAMKAMIILNENKLGYELCLNNSWQSHYMPILKKILDESLNGRKDQHSFDILSKYLECADKHPLMFVNAFPIFLESICMLSNLSTWEEIFQSVSVHVFNRMQDICFKFFSHGIYNFFDPKDCFLVIDSLLTILITLNSHQGSDQDIRNLFMTNVQHLLEYFLNDMPQEYERIVLDRFSGQNMLMLKIWLEHALTIRNSALLKINLKSKMEGLSISSKWYSLVQGERSARIHPDFKTMIKHIESLGPYYI